MYSWLDTHTCTQIFKEIFINISQKYNQILQIFIRVKWMFKPKYKFSTRFLSCLKSCLWNTEALESLINFSYSAEETPRYFQKFLQEQKHECYWGQFLPPGNPTSSLVLGLMVPSHYWWQILNKFLLF